MFASHITYGRNAYFDVQDLWFDFQVANKVTNAGLVFGTKRP